MKEKIIVLTVSIVLWFLLMPVMTTNSLGRTFAFIPLILIAFFVYKIIEKIFNLQKINLWFILAFSFVGIILSWLSFFVIFPECGSSHDGWGSRSIECECKGIPVTLDTSWALDAYGTRTVCLGAGKSFLGSPQKEILIEACRRNSCTESMSFNVDSDYLKNETINCKTAVILEKDYAVNIQGVC